MNVALWIVQGLLAAAFLSAGTMKIVRPRKRLMDSGMGWAGDFSDAGVKAIGAVEVLGAIGLILPAALGIATLLTPLAATGLALIMAGGAVVHLRRGEGAGAAAPSLVLGVLATVVAVMRFGLYAF